MSAPLFRRHPQLNGVFLIYCAVALSFMWVDNQFPRVRQVALSATTPILYLAELPSTSYQAIKNGISTHEQLRRDNAELSAQLMVLRAQLQTYQSLQTENRQLHALLDSATAKGGQFRVAKLLKVEAHPHRHIIWINQGENHQVYRGQPVFDAFGVMGQVIAVGKTTARVMLISDPDSAIPVQLLRSGQRAILAGRGEMDSLSLINLPKTVDIKVGDQLVTSGLGDCYPPGYTVGCVAQVKHTPGERFATIRVKPASHLNRSRLVLLARRDS